MLRVGHLSTIQAIISKCFNFDLKNCGLKFSSKFFRWKIRKIHSSYETHINLPAFFRCQFEKIQKLLIAFSSKKTKQKLFSFFVEFFFCWIFCWSFLFTFLLNFKHHIFTCVRTVAMSEPLSPWATGMNLLT